VVVFLFSFHNLVPSTS